MLKVEDDGPTRWLILNRPERRNALNPMLVADLRDAFCEAMDDPAVAVVVIAGAGSSFCAGADLAYLYGTRDGSDGVEFLTAVSQCFATVAAGDKPVVAALHGHAIAGGLELALSCDVVVAESGTLIGDGHAAMGLLPAGGASLRLPNRIGESLARWMMLTGEHLTAEALMNAGLVHEVAPSGELAKTVADVCRRLLAANLTAQRATKRLLSVQASRPPAEALANELQAFAEHWKNAPLLELSAFVTRSGGPQNTALQARAER